MLTKSLTADEQRVLSDIYLNSFPPEERRPWADIVRKTEDKDSGLDFFIIRQAGNPVGFMTVWCLSSGLYYIEHFAVDESLRGKGVGSRAIAALRAALPGCIILEVEPPLTGAVARRRIGFYRRNGFVLYDDFDYVQPPYAQHLPEVPLKLMGSGRLPMDLDRIAAIIHKRIYGK